MAEIVLAEPIQESTSSTAASTSRRGYTTSNERPFTRSITFGRDHVPEPFDSEKLPVTLISEIQRFLRVANLIESEEPRVAYLCRFHAFEVAHNLDRNSNGRGVRQFKTALLQRLEQDEEVTLRKRKEKTDLRELRRAYREYKDYIIKYGAESHLENRERLTKARAIASVLFEVSDTVSRAAGVQALAGSESRDAKSELFVSYNILPLDQGGIHHAIMQLPEIKVAVAAVRDVRGLPFLEDCRKHTTNLDLFNWLQFCFGFQEGNVANQREHLILLLANAHVRQTQKQVLVPKLGDVAVDELMKKFFKNYTDWCKFLGRKSNIRVPYLKQEAQQYKLLYIGLYLLIWGEAANLRFMPECLCYIFHHMAYELHSMLIGAVSMTTGEKLMPAYQGNSESFLNNVVSPVYDVIYKEAMKSRNGTADHSTWRNYDDLNEFFWSPDCFQIGWPMRLDHDFFCIGSPSNLKVRKEKASVANQEGNKKDANEDEEMGILVDEVREPKWLGKMSFVEIRSFWQIFRSFDRMWSFFILSLQAMIIMASHDLDSPLQVFDATVLEDVMSIFITSAVIKLVNAILDIIFTWKARCTVDPNQTLKHVLRVVVAMMWTIILPIYYASSRRKYTCYSTQSGSWLGEWCYSSYMVAVAFYLMTNAIDMVLFFVPVVGKYIETSNYRICMFLSWWTQPKLYVGRGMQESQVSLLKYTIFWMLLLISKFIFSYAFEIKPLISPTRQIMAIGVKNYDWHELFPKVKSNAGAIAAIWAPIVLVRYISWMHKSGILFTVPSLAECMESSTILIRTLGMLRSRFHTLPDAFNARLVPPQAKDTGNILKNWLIPLTFQKNFHFSEREKNNVVKFVLVWNQIINSFREEDVISDREMDLMKMPVFSELFSGRVCWPVFLLADKLSKALSIARDFEGKDEVLLRTIKKDTYMYMVVTECYESLKYILEILVVGDLERRVISGILDEIEECIQRSTLLKDLKMSELPVLSAKCITLLELLIEGNESHHNKVVLALQDIFELVISDLMLNGSRTMELLYAHLQSGEEVAELFSWIEPPLFASKHSIHFPLPDSGSLMEKVKRFRLLLTVEDKALGIPTNLEARRRISFFATSLFMNMPNAPKVRNMLSFSVLTPHYMEEVKFSKKELNSTKQGVAILFYLKNIFPDEWENFLERMERERSDESNDELEEEERNWASFRGQTLSRTVRGMMYYRKALKLQAFLDMAEDDDILQGYDAIEKKNDTLSAQLEALADMKFTHVVSCQIYGSQKNSGDPQAKDILDLMIRYPSLRVAYVEEKEEITADKPRKVYSSILVKAVNGFDQEVYRIKLPGPPNIGEGKPENQNHSIIFTRGEALQTIDMNQDSYLEEALKVRNILQEFLKDHGRRHPTVLGMREHIFTGSVSSLAWFMSYQETSFVTIGQRLLANPLRVRFHYGHPDLFDRVFHLTRGGISKASKTINLSEDVFAGFNTTLRRGYVTYLEYMQVGKGRDVGLNQISKFEAKVANGNSEQTISRDIYRLGHRFDFFRMLSCYFTTVGFYFNSLLSVITIYVFLYGQLYLVLSGLQRALLIEAKLQNIKSLETALASQSFIQLGLLTGLPMVIELGLERGYLNALKDFVLMQLQLAAVFFTFSYGTKSHYYGRTILHGGAKYRPTGRKVVVFHASFTENYRLYSRSHFIKGFELLLLLIVYDLYRRSYESNMAYVLTTYAIWFMSLTWLFAPFLFNPSGFDWGKIMDDWKDWNKWINQQGGIGIQQDKSWQSWWNDEQAHLRHAGLFSRLIEILLSLRFFLYQYGLVYHLDISGSHKNFLVYVLSWVVIAFIFLLVKVLNIGRRVLSANHQLTFRLFKAFIFLGVVATTITLSIICHLSVKDLIVCCLAFLPTGWGFILVGQAVRPKIEGTGLWHFTRVFARAYDYGMGVVLFAPISSLAWLPIISAFQTRFLFNEAFSRRLQIQPILAGKKNH
ncbi:putative callose synthase 8 isoform X2 [Nicotiana tomentosiformis]|uniref:putative callose synthase 8 isoform X2 n=1 Tax=Nicotiana tomentosiformis TaxID=4098 RepID=UPI00051B0DAA|nr:putative callose synthase 8 isoform X2 [Nicotiana tomentosiformis]